jgi:hypothetical protein
MTINPSATWPHAELVEEARIVRLLVALLRTISMLTGKINADTLQIQLQAMVR